MSKNDPKPEGITVEHFYEAVGRLPENDDLERSNCKKAGLAGHHSCGWNWEKNLPNFMVGPVFRNE